MMLTSTCSGGESAANAAAMLDQHVSPPTWGPVALSLRSIITWYKYSSNTLYQASYHTQSLSNTLYQASYHTQSLLLKWQSDIQTLGSGRIVASDIAAPNMLANLVWSG
jgi:hypothetical protein